MAEDLVTLGFAFSSGNADTEINKLISAFNNLDEKSQGAKNTLGKLFGGEFTTRIDAARKAIGKFNAGIIQTANFAKKATNSLRVLPNQIANISADKIKPVPSAVIESLRVYADSARLAAEAMTKLKDIPSKITPAPVQKFGKEIKNVESNTSSLFSEFQRLFSSGTLLMFFRNSTVEAIKFGEEIAHITSLTMEYDPTKMRTGILNVSSELGNATKVAEAAYYAFSSGVRGGEENLVKFTADMSKLATLIRAGVTPTVDAATSAMNAYNLTAKDSGELVDLFYAIVKQGKAHGEQLASGLGQVISTAATAGVSLDEMGASVASLTKVMQTRNAITYFNNMLSKMIKPTKECRLAAQKLGIELGLDALKAKGFAGMMQEIHDKTKGSQQAILSMFPDLRGQRAALQLLNKGWGDFQNQLKFFANKSGVADAAMKELSDDINFQLSVIPNTFAKIKIAVGDLLASTLTLGGALTPIITGFNRMGEGGQKFVAALVLIAGAYGVMRGVQFAHRTLQAVEIRNNEVLAAQRDKEVQQRMAIAASAKAQAAATTSANAANGASATSGAVSAANAGPNASMAAAMKQQQEYNALKLKLESESTIAASARVKETEAIYQQNLALAQSAAIKKAETAETAELTAMIEKDAAWRAAMTTQNQSYFASISKQGIAERELAAATLERATADRIAAAEAAKKAAMDSANAKNVLAQSKLEMQKAQAAAISASLHEKEVAYIAKQTAMENMQTAAVKRSNMTLTQQIAIIKAEMRERAHNASLAYTEAQAIYEKTKANGSSAAAVAAYKDMIAAKTAFVAADNEAEKWNNILLAQKSGILSKNNALMIEQMRIQSAATAATAANTTANATNSIIEIAKTGSGFSAGFKAIFSTAAFMKNFNASASAMKSVVSGLIHPFRSLKSVLTAIHTGGIVSSIASSFTALKASMAVFLTGFGAVLGKIATFASAIFTAAHVIITGAVAAVVGLIDIVQSFWRTGDKYKGSFILQPLANWIMGVSKLAECVKEMDKQLAGALRTSQALAAIRTFAQDIRNEFAQQLKEQIVIPDLDVQQQINEYYKPLSNLFKQRVKEFDNVTLEAAQKRVEEASIKFRNYQMKMARHLAEGKKLTDHNNEKLASLEKAFEEAKENADKLREEANKNASGILSYSQKMRELVKQQRDAISSIMDTQEGIRYKQMSPSQQMNEQDNRFYKYASEYYDAVKKGNADLAQKTFKNMVSAYEILMKDAEEKLKKYKSMQESLKGDAFDYLLKSMQTVPQKVAALRQRAVDLYRESGGRWFQNAQGQWNFQIPQGSNTDLEASYAKAKQAIGMQIQALQEEINAKNKLAQAEQRANENTVRLIQSMDKFKETTASAVNAYSLEAQKLQSRSFSAPVRIQPVTTAQTSLSNSNAQMQTLMQQAQQMISQYQQAAAAREQAAAAQRAKLMTDMKQTMDDNDKSLQSIDDNIKKMNEALLMTAEAVNRIANDNQIVTPLRNLEKAVSSVTTVTY